MNITPDVDCSKWYLINIGDVFVNNCSVVIFVKINIIYPLFFCLITSLKILRNPFSMFFVQ